MCVCGTRPEVIKIAPLVSCLKQTDWANVFLLSTGQHREMLDQELRYFGLVADKDLNVMQANQQLPQLTARLIESVDEVLQDKKIDMIVVQGDTSTTFATTLVSFYRKIPVAYVEAGLRSHDVFHPFPEEMNRILISRIAALNFAPTEVNKKNLLAEGINESSIFVTGNTVVDALLEVAKRPIPIGIELDPSKKLIIVTAHRRENLGAPFVRICEGIRQFADAATNVQIVFPVHQNPKVSLVAHELLSNHPRIFLIKPLDYGQQVTLMKQSYFIITDSGGIQEEAPTFAKPLLILRDNTDRPEGVAAGVAKIIGTTADSICVESMKLLTDKTYYDSMSNNTLLYGDGHASKRIRDYLKQYFDKRINQ